jgi:hypothetical protein
MKYNAIERVTHGHSFVSAVNWLADMAPCNPALVRL